MVSYLILALLSDGLPSFFPYFLPPSPTLYLPPLFSSPSGNAQCFTASTTCSGANIPLGPGQEPDRDCCVGDGMSFNDGSRCEICYGKFAVTICLPSYPVEINFYCYSTCDIHTFVRISFTVDEFEELINS